MQNFIIVLLSLFFFASCQSEKGEFVCPPCDLPCDTIAFQQSGTCPHCNMELIRKEVLVLNEIKLVEGSGVFLIEGRKGATDRAIKVFYHKPRNYSKGSKILMVIPGAGRNGDSYRDAWIEESEKYGVLILSPMFAENAYPFEDYHLCGLMKDINLREAIEFKENTNNAILDESKFSYSLNTNSEEWLFRDFDRIFYKVVEAIGSSQTNYDLFGHSAGGQILHRMALFSKNEKANRIVAGNSGFFTVPDAETQMPFGIADMAISESDMAAAFSKKLIVLVGELDNESETGGTLLRSETVDKQGLHRLARAQYFYDFSKKRAETLGTDFNWELQIVSNVGHNHRKMGNAAGRFLYENVE